MPQTNISTNQPHRHTPLPPPGTTESSEVTHSWYHGLCSCAGPVHVHSIACTTDRACTRMHARQPAITHPPRTACHPPTHHSAEVAAGHGSHHHVAMNRHDSHHMAVNRN
eukprot:2535933-Prymnesium_polylepis.2